MKKLFTLTTLLTLMLTVSAQNYRKWNFTQWSPQTIANLADEAARGGVTGGAWSDTEKANGDNPQPGKCYWSYSADNAIDGVLSANGVAIAEAEGLVFNPAYVSRRSLAIAVDYPSTSLGDYAGPQYLWLGGGNAKSAGARIYCFTIPKVGIGQKITMEVESHKPSDSRGVSLFVGDCTDDANQIGESFKPTTKASYTWEAGWTLPDGAVTNDDGTVDIQVYNTNGCHIYSIEVGDNSQKAKVAYLYEGSLEAELAYTEAIQSAKYDVEPLKVTGVLTLDALTQYDAIVISSTVTNGDAVSSLNQLQPFVPTLNLNPALYAAWEVGQAVDAGTPFAVVSNPNSSLFRNLDESQLLEDPDNPGTYVLVVSNNLSFQGVTLAGRFQDDNIVATAMGNEDVVAIHQHNMSHNGYIFVPYTQELLADAISPNIIPNALDILVNTKAQPSQAPAPTFSLEYKDMKTIVTIRSSVGRPEIFYTTDGTTPTEQSTRYTEPLTLTAETNVKAVVRGDGYLLSDVATQLVDLRRQLPAPVITLTKGDGQTTVELTSEADAENISIYYNFTGSDSKAKSSLYDSEQPVVVSQLGRTIYAFATADGFVDSDLAEKAVPVSNPKVRIDILAHMDANADEYNGGSTSTAYYFSWGKDKASYPYYNTDTVTEEIVTDPETGDETVVTTYTEMNPEEEKDFGNGWMVRSRGQLIIWENLSTGSDVGDSNAYNVATAADINPDFPITKYVVNLADKNTQPSDVSFPYNAYIVTTAKYQGPFDVVANVASITKPDAGAKHTVVFQASADGNQWESTWVTIGDTINFEGARLTHNIVRSYEGTDEVYVRAYLCGNNSKTGFYDLYIANEGEKSKQRIEEYASGIETVNTSHLSPLTSTVYDLQGRRLSGKPARGIYIVNGRKYMVK